MSSSLRLKTWQDFDSSHEQDYHSQWTSLREFHEKEQHEWGRAWSKPFIHQFDLRFVSRLFQSHLISIYSLLRAWRRGAKNSFFLVSKKAMKVSCCKIIPKICKKNLYLPFFVHIAMTSFWIFASDSRNQAKVMRNKLNTSPRKMDG